VESDSAADCHRAGLSIPSGQPLRYTIFSGRSRTHRYDAAVVLDFGLPSTPVQEPEEDDWFGEGNAFESGEDLAIALLAMAASPAVEEVEAETPAAQVPVVRDSFLLTDQDVLPRPALVAEPVRVAATLAPRGWSVRKPGAIPLPPREPGRSGWSIRNSVKVLQHTESVMNTLREEAVVATLVAAARAIHPD